MRKGGAPSEHCSSVYCATAAASRVSDRSCPCGVLRGNPVHLTTRHHRHRLESSTGSSSHRTNGSSAMDSRPIGALQVSIVGLGCNNFGMTIDEHATARVVDAAIDVGINFF